MIKNQIDVNFNFTLDTPCYWDRYWEQDELLGTSNNDRILRAKLCNTIIKYYGVELYQMGKIWILKLATLTTI